MLTKTFVPLDQIRLFRPEGFPSPAAAAPPSPPGATTVINNQSHSSFFLSLRKKKTGIIILFINFRLEWRFHFGYLLEPAMVLPPLQPPPSPGAGAAATAARVSRRHSHLPSPGAGAATAGSPGVPRRRARRCCHLSAEMGNRRKSGQGLLD